MISYLLITSLLIPINIWAAITPHLHSDLSMRLLHGVSAIILLPLLITLWHDRNTINQRLALLLAVFVTVLIAVNSYIASEGMGVRFGWVIHLMLAGAALCVEIYFLAEERASSPF